MLCLAAGNVFLVFLSSFEFLRGTVPVHTVKYLQTCRWYGTFRATSPVQNQLNLIIMTRVYHQLEFTQILLPYTWNKEIWNLLYILRPVLAILGKAARIFPRSAICQDNAKIYWVQIWQRVRPHSRHTPAERHYYFGDIVKTSRETPPT